MRFFPLVFFLILAAPKAWAQLPYAIFEDVPSTKPYYDQVNLLRERMITYGCNAYPANYCPEPPYTLTRGQAATLIIRAIYSARTGDPEGFPDPPSTPYFTDVPPEHAQFKYIQKMRELGIANGVTATTFEPWGTLSFGQTAVFAHRARQLRQWQPITAPYACSYPPFSDVPAEHIFCPYIRDMAAELGYDKAISPSCWTGFCPDNIAMPRGILAFYLVNGVMNVGQPQWLPNGGGSVPGVWLPGPPEPDCSRGGPEGDFAYGNQIVVLGGTLHSWANTYVNQPGNPAVWNQYTAMGLFASGNRLYFAEDFSAHGSNWSGIISGTYAITANWNYRNDAWHSVASMCLPSGNSWFTSVNNPIIISMDTSVLYRGTSQTITVRGSTLQNLPWVHLEGLSTPIPSSIISASQYQTTLLINSPNNLGVGSRKLYLSAVSPNNGLRYATNSWDVTVQDQQPALSSITPNMGNQGTSVPAVLSGNNFGANPKVCILVSGNCMQTFNDVSIARGPCGPWPACNNQIPLTITIGNNATLGNYNIAVQSQGADGFGFQSSGGVSPPTSTVAFQVQSCSSSVTLAADSFNPFAGVVYRANFTSLGIPASGTFNWSSSDPSVASVTPLSGQPNAAYVDSSSHGKVTITVTYTSPCGRVSTASRTYVRTRDVSVLGYVDKPKIETDWQNTGLESQVSDTLGDALLTPNSCATAIASWIVAGQFLTTTFVPAMYSVETEPDRIYANYYLLSRSANSSAAMPLSDYPSVATAANQPNHYRLLQRTLALWEVDASNNRIGQPQFLATGTWVGLSLEPCSGVAIPQLSPTGEFHQGFDGQKGVDVNGLIYHVNEVRVGSGGQEVNWYLNRRSYPNAQSTVPYVHSTIQFAPDGSLVPLASNPGNSTDANASRFPSFRIYYSIEAGMIYQPPSRLASDFIGFIDLDATYYYRVP